MAKKGLKDPTKRSRTSKPKVTTGCITCKARHVKCDEKKPHCHRCKSTGRKCDWTSHVKPTPILETAKVSFPIKQFPGTSEENNHFQFFCTKTRIQLSGLFGSTFWSQHVLQVCVSQPAIWHAAVAVASLQQERNATTFGVGEEDAPLSNFTVMQYVKAMQHLRVSHHEHKIPAVDIALLCCVLFICFESLRGHYATALVHLDYGLRLLSEVEAKDPKQSSASDGLHSSNTSFASIQSLSLIFTGLDTQAKQLLPTRKSSLTPTLEILKYGKLQHIPTICTSLEETRSISDQAWNFSLHSLHTPPGMTSVPFGHTRAATLQLCAAKFNQASSAFERFMEHSGNKLDAMGRQAANVMRICHIVAAICLNPEYHKNMDNEDIFLQREREFSEIVCLATDIIDSSVVESLGGDTVRFTLDSCVLGPLYFVAMRCRHKILRRKAISLLRLSRRLEGLWDSYLLAQLAERAMEIEERRNESPTDSLRISDIDVRFESDRRRASVRYIFKGCQDALDAKLRDREDFVVW